MAFFFTEQQVVEAARKAYREHAEADQKALAEWRSKGPVKLSDWTDPDTENSFGRPAIVGTVFPLFGRINPARDVGTVTGASGKRDRALSIAELRAYWLRICALPDPAGAALRFHLLTGGQRIEQLARATKADIDGDAHAVLLLDPKGRREEPRRHWVPLLEEAEACITAMGTPRLGPFIWSVTHGETPLSESTMRDRVAEVCGDMIEAGETLERFTPGERAAK